MFRRPIYRDWLVWWGVVVVVAYAALGIDALMWRYGPETVVALMIDAVWEVGARVLFGVVVFVLIPAVVRERWRVRKTRGKEAV